MFIKKGEMKKMTGEKIYVCKYCGQSFASMQGLKSHLKNCPKRSLPKVFSKGKVTFVCYMNPRRRVVNAINSLLRKSDFDERQLLGVVRYLEEEGTVHRTQVPEISQK